MITRRIGAEEFEGGDVLEKGGKVIECLSRKKKAVCCVREGGKEMGKGRLTNLPLKSEDVRT